MEEELAPVHCWLGNWTMENRERVSRERLRCNQSKTEKELTPGSPVLRDVGGGCEGGDSKDQPWVGPHDARQRFRLDYRDEEVVLAFITSIWDRGSEPRHRQCNDDQE